MKGWFEKIICFCISRVEKLELTENLKLHLQHSMHRIPAAMDD